MKSPPSIPTLTRHVAAALVAFGLTASCTSDEIVGAIDDGDDGGTPPTPTVDGSTPAPDTGTPDTGPGPRCGDGNLDPGEECDDGNAVSGDGCSIACKNEETPMVPEDACPGGDFPLTVSGNTRSGSVTGNNSSLNPNYETTCGGGAGKDAIYKITSDRAGRAVARLSAEFAGILSLRGNCTPSTNESVCKAATAEGQDVELVFPLAAGQTIFVVVDALASGTGNYTLSIDVTDSSCGDGVAQLPEQCDDGNTVNGDGCNDACQFEDPPSAPGTCPGASYTLVGDPAAPVTVSFAGDTSLSTNVSGARDCAPSGISWSSSGKDIVYAITPTLPGSLKTILHATYARPSLHVRQECYLQNSEYACAYALPAEPIATTIPVVANQTYYVFVDSGATLGGPFSLEATWSPALCGDGVKQTGEECDDGNDVAGDGCANCSFEPAPSGIESCPGSTIAFDVGPDDTRTFSIVEDLSRLSADVWVACGPVQTPAATSLQRTKKDAVYTFVAPYNGYLEAEVRANSPVSLNLRTTCVPLSSAGPGTSTGSTACSTSQNLGAATFSLRTPVVGGQTYFLMVKEATNGTNATGGRYELDVKMRPAVCGNGVIEGTEQCDDGPWPVGYNNESGCTAACAIAPNAATGITCAAPDVIALTETAEGSERYEAHVVSGNWNRPNTTFFQPNCATGGNQQFFRIDPPISGVMVARTTGTYPIVLGAKANCVTANTSTLGVSCFASSAEQTLAIPVTQGTPVNLVVDAPSALITNKGRFELDIAISPPSCGDTLLSGAEECDDGNVVAGDGCSPTCTIETAADSDVCPGTNVSLEQAADGSYAGRYALRTSDAQANYAGTCGGAGRDRVARVVAPISGTLSAQLEAQGGWTPLLYARDVCADSTSQRACVLPTSTKPQPLVETAVTAGQEVFLFADGNAGQSGPANLQIVITP